MSDVLPSRFTSSSRRSYSDTSHLLARTAPVVVCRPVAAAPELAAHHEIRHEVFVVEQGLFADSDVDAHDADPDTVHLLGLVGDEPAGTVRLWPQGSGIWKGDRLAVLHRQRHVGLGRPLVRLAVTTAAELGGDRMNAQVQVGTVRFFQALGWAVDGEPYDYLGAIHQHMTIELR
ncbi:MAG: MSMEG_0567/Sll0786 family nitrogen starvation N-acetyltransferase [Candidatus Nanopelagicales bacterium]